MLVERGVVNTPATRDIASRGRDLVGRGAVGVNLLALSPQSGEVSLVRLKVQRLWSNRNASSFPQQARRSHACPLLRGAHTGALPQYILRRLGDAAIPWTDGSPIQARGVWRRVVRVGSCLRGSAKTSNQRPTFTPVSYRSPALLSSRRTCHIWRPQRELNCKYKPTPSADWLTVQVGAPTCLSSRRCRAA